jgi:hypothetical protein
MLPQPRLLSAREAQPPESPNPPEWLLEPLKAFECESLPCCAHELSPKDRSPLELLRSWPKLCEPERLILTVLPLMFRLTVVLL